LCTESCTQKAIEWTPDFVHTVFTRGKLVKQLNKS
jgi:formate hydrogenlyase subunit 6/NADH:ubiquinone oxidoreductase subunit I